MIRESPYFLVGTMRAIREKISALRTSLGISSFVIKGSAAEPFAPIVAELGGR